MAIKLSVVIGTPDLAAWPFQLLTGTFEEKIRKSRELGFDGVELISGDIDRVDREAVKKTLEKYDMACPAFNTGPVYGKEGLCLMSPDTEIEQLGMHQLEGFLEFAGEFGAVVDIGMLRGRLGIMPEPSKALEELAEKFRRAAEVAAHCGSRITLEPINRFESDCIHNAQDGLAWVNRVNHPRFGLMLDTFHMNIEDASIQESVRETAHCLWHVHVGDSNRLSAGRGHFDFPGLIQTLKETGYEGYLSAEHLTLPDPDSAAQNTVRYLRQLV